VELITPDAAAERYRARGMPEAFVAAVREGTTALRDGVAATLTNDVERVLSRPARTFAAWVEENVRSFQGPDAIGDVVGT